MKMFGEMPWVTLERRVRALESKSTEEVMLNFERLDKAIAEIISTLDLVRQDVADLKASKAADQAEVDKRAATLESAVSVGGSQGGITA